MTHLTNNRHRQKTTVMQERSTELCKYHTGQVWLQIPVK